MRRVLRTGGWLLMLLLGAGTLVLVHAHIRIRQERTALPAVAEITRLAEAADRPVRLAWVNTASQPMARSSVLDPRADPGPDAPYVMSHPSFVLQWADGRLLLIDLGMTRAGALAFGNLLHRVGAAEAIVPHTTVAEALGAAAQRVRGIVFTHLHDDHVGGLDALCDVIHGPVPVFMTEAQSERPNHTDRGGRRLIRQSGCVREQRLQGEGVLGVDGFPGVGVVRVAGHTPGSQVIVAYVGAQGYAFVGDVVNHIDGIRSDVPKPFLYSLLIVPEDRERLGEVRRYLRGLQTDQHLILLPAHDQRWIEKAGIDSW